MNAAPCRHPGPAHVVAVQSATRPPAPAERVRWVAQPAPGPLNPSPSLSLALFLSSSLSLPLSFSRSLGCSIAALRRRVHSGTRGICRPPARHRWRVASVAAARHLAGKSRPAPRLAARRPTPHSVARSDRALSSAWRRLRTAGNSVARKHRRACRNGFDMIQSQPLRSSFKLIISFTFSSLMFKSSDSERLDKFSEVLAEF